MAELINLNRARKQRARAAKEKQAAHNRVQFGTPKALRDQAQQEEARTLHILDQHKRERDDD